MAEKETRGEMEVMGATVYWWIADGCIMVRVHGDEGWACIPIEAIKAALAATPQ